MTSRLDVAGLGAYIREQREAAEVSLRQLAKASGVSNPYLSQVERGLRNPSAEILGQIAKALRISAETLYVRAGLLDERTDDGTPVMITVPEAIAADPILTERQRGALLDIYAAFLSDNSREADAVSPELVEPEIPATTRTTRRATRPAAAR